jgi:5-methylcytosine-specific restriction endonuclease McrA
MGDPWRSGQAWEVLRSQVFAEESVCWICLELVDFEAAPRTAPSPSVDHVKPAITHPHLAMERSNLRLAHYGCNSRRSARGEMPYTPSRDW